METNQPVPVPVVKKTFPFKPVLISVAVIVVLLLGFFGYKVFLNKDNGADQGGEIVWWGLWEDETTVKSLISDYETKNPKVKIKYVRQSKEDYRERLTNAIAKGTAPDVFRFHNTWVPMFRNDLDKVPQTLYSSTDFSNNFYPVAVSDLTIGTSIVGIPLEFDALSLYINEELFEKSGKNIPSTWNELRQVARELTVKDQSGGDIQSGVALGRTENVDHWPEILGLMMLQNGVDLSNPTGQLAEDALQFYTIFSSVDGVWDETLPSSTVAFSSGKLAMYFGPSWRAFEIRLQNPGLRFKTVPVPQLPKTSANESDVTYASYWVEGVWARSSKKTIAWDFVKYLSSKESLQLFYQNASKIRMFGEPYPIVSMSPLLIDHPVIGSTMQQASYAQTWFLQSRTWDGPTGINSQITKYFEDAVNAVNSGKSSVEALEAVPSGVIQVLSQYGIKVR